MVRITYSLRVVLYFSEYARDGIAQMELMLLFTQK